MKIMIKWPNVTHVQRFRSEFDHANLFPWFQIFDIAKFDFCYKNK